MNDGRVGERFMPTVLKTVEPDEGSVGSNPTSSSIYPFLMLAFSTFGVSFVSLCFPKDSP